MQATFKMASRSTMPFLKCKILLPISLMSLVVFLLISGNINMLSNVLINFNHEKFGNSTRAHCENLCTVKKEIPTTNNDSWSFFGQTAGVLHCAMSIEVLGRLGNTMAEYATLYALAQINNRPAFILKEMSSVLRKYFKITLPTYTSDYDICLKNNGWNIFKIKQWMEEPYRNISGVYVMLKGYPYSWTYYHHIRDEILKEFTLQDHLYELAQNELRNVRKNRSSVIFVGVHARRSDYVQLMKESYKGTVADEQFFENAMNYYRKKYANVVFIVVSDDMKWCRENMKSVNNDIYFGGDGDIDDPIHDMALLMNCNHSIITIGTYGFWAAYLAGGETVHFTNYMLPDSPYLKRMKYEKLYLPNWKAIAANLTKLIPMNRIN